MTALVNIAPIEAALAAAVATGDVPVMRDVHAMATALREGARARGLGVEAENEAATLILRTERAIGSLLNEYGAMAGDNQHSTGPSNPEPPVTFASLGISESDGLRWKRLARVPVERFEALLEDARSKQSRIAKYNFYNALRERASQEQQEASRDLVDAIAGAPDPAAFVQWDRASRALIGGDLLPLDTMLKVADTLRSLVAWYSAYRETHR